MLIRARRPCVSAFPVAVRTCRLIAMNTWLCPVHHHRHARHGSLEVRQDNQVAIFSVDYDELVRYELGNEINEGDKLSFLRAVIKRLNPRAA